MQQLTQTTQLIDKHKLKANRESLLAICKSIYQEDNHMLDLSVTAKLLSMSILTNTACPGTWCRCDVALF